MNRTVAGSVVLLPVCCLSQANIAVTGTADYIPRTWINLYLGVYDMLPNLI